MYCFIIYRIYIEDTIPLQFTNIDKIRKHFIWKKGLDIIKLCLKICVIYYIYFFKKEKIVIKLRHKKKVVTKRNTH